MLGLKTSKTTRVMTTKFTTEPLKKNCRLNLEDVTTLLKKSPRINGLVGTINNTQVYIDDIISIYSTLKVDDCKGLVCTPEGLKLTKFECKGILFLKFLILIISFLSYLIFQRNVFILNGLHGLYAMVPVKQLVYKKEPKS